ncbi:MAG TPA: hypothetical protein DCG69_00530 [Bacteroidales bacterium]|nr:hypothetical protein [Bacteroidales bacterium]
MSGNKKDKLKRTNRICIIRSGFRLGKRTIENLIAFSCIFSKDKNPAEYQTILLKFINHLCLQRKD